MKKLLAVLILAATEGLCQDSLVSFKDLSFNSDFEKHAFQRYFFQKDNSTLALLLSATPLMTDEKAKVVDEQIGGIVAAIKAEDLEKKKPDKRIRTIYDKTHNPLLRKYQLENRFYDVFTTGNYNCVTATALYALILENLGIPYEIKEEPTHVYLLGYPNKENIIIETTSPLFGYVSFTSGFRTEYVSNLKKQKIIDPAEADTKTADELFNKYYFKNEKITLKELVGIHYMNDALFRRDHGEWQQGYHALEKAYLLYPSARCRYLLMLFAAQITSHEKLTSKEKSVMVGKLSRFNAEGITSDMIKGEFINLTRELLFRENNRALYTECYQTLLTRIKDKNLANEINYVYNYENGRAYYNLGDYVKSKPFFEKALRLQPNNLDLGSLFVEVLGQSFRSLDNGKSALDTLNKYKGKYSSLTQFRRFNSFVGNLTLEQFGLAFEGNRVDEAKKYKDTFDGLMKETPDLDINDGMAGKAFSSAGSYYFKKGQKAKARELLQEGLKYAPNNYQLRVRLQMIQ